MSLLSERDIAQMRSTLDESLPDTAIIEQRSFTDNLGGGGTLAWTASGTIEARVTPTSSTAYGSEDLLADRLAENADWIITLPATTSVTTDSRIRIGSRTFNVLAAHAPRSWELSRRLEVNEEV